MNLSRLTLAQKALAFVFLLGIIPLLLVGTVTYGLSTRTLEVESKRYAWRVVSDEDKELNLILGQFESLLTSLSSSEEIRKLLKESGGSTFSRLSTEANVGYILNSYLNLRGLIAINLFAVDGRHYHVGDTLAAKEIRQDVRDQLFEEAMRPDRLGVWTGIESNVVIHSAFQKVITAATLITEIDSQSLTPQPIGLITLSYNPAEIARDFDQSEQRRSEFYWIVDAKGRYIYDRDSQRIGSYMEPELFARFSQDRGEIEIRIPGDTLITTYQKMTRTGWIIAYNVPFSAMTAPSRELAVATLIIIVISFLLVAIVTSFASRTAIHPITEITNSFQRLQQHITASHPRLPIRSEDEIGELTRWFNSFLDNLEIRQTIEKEVRERAEFEELIARISAEFINVRTGHVDEAVNRALARIGTFTAVDRSYVFMFPFDQPGIVSNTHEWVAEGITSEINKMRALPEADIAHLLAPLYKYTYSYVADVSALPPARAKEKELLLSQGIQSLILIPMTWQGAMIGFLGFDSVRQKRSWDSEIIRLLTLVGQILITALKRSEAEREQERLIAQLQEAKAKAQESSRLKSEFLSMVSHELRTPLNAIEGFTSVMLQGMGVSLDPKARGMLERVHVNSQRLLYLINDILDLSRIESERFDLIYKPASPARLAERWHDHVAVIAANKGLMLETIIDPTLPDPLITDEDALSKVVVNLLSNAVKFTHQGAVKLIWTFLPEKQQWSIQVIDTGIGIPSHAHSYIFEEFRQVDQSSKRQYGGTGLGLAIVRRLVLSMKGQINLESEPGKGSAFTVTLPLLSAHPGANANNIAGVSQSGNE
ncbi:MAG: HAMP domain-containing protein [Anaerolinea sp.]|nr:HAMP domain-containing protein [Anaerolinea sp.]MCC6975949.1 HAMP domain-containing protein [Anaerolineae bacterium]CAG0960269.1 two-component system, NarL family, sensor histidine kinase BarA [Anaerolineae bacterium]